MTVVDAMDKRGDVAADLGETIYVRVVENPTTGYRWSVESLDTDLLRLEGSEFETSGSGIGAAGKRTFVFTAASRGRGQIVLRLWREWQGTGTVIDTRELTVTVD